MAEQVDQDTIDLIESNYRKLFGALMRLKRVHKQLTHDDLVESSYTSRPTLSKIESASQHVKKSTLAKVAKALDITDDEIDLLRSFAGAVNPDEGTQILLSNNVRDHIANARITEIFTQTVDISSKSPDTSKKPEMFGRTIMAIAITQDHEALSKAILPQLRA
ncbi:MAG: helix-turn-helix domain-containing protein [Alphaproteobacteria bacterium]|nr:helix-turn-helix domain-containing protein [Alphaproteobacteria bacterium]